MNPPKSFLDFTLQFHQDLDIVHPEWASTAPNARQEIYKSFRASYGDAAVRELAAFFVRRLADSDSQLKSLWNRKSKADWMLSGDGVRKIFEEFVSWADSMQI